MTTIDGGDSARFAGVVGYSVADDIALARARAGGVVDGDDYTYDRHVIPNKRGGVTVVDAEPLTPYPERNDARVAALERFLAALEDAVAEHDKTLEEHNARLAHIEAMLHQALNREPTP